MKPIFLLGVLAVTLPPTSDMVGCGTVLKCKAKLWIAIMAPNNQKDMHAVELELLARIVHVGQV